MLLCAAVLVVVCVIFYYKAIKPLSYWKDRGIPHKRSYPFIGSLSTVFFFQKAFFYYSKELYQTFSKERYYGVHQFNNAGLYIKDLELIKIITVKHFDQFIDHSTFAATEIDLTTTRSLFNLKGQRWRDMRSTLSPSFTSSKMKLMFSLVSECAKDLTSYFEKQPNEIQQIEMKDVFTRFTNDVIASTAFGFKCNSLEEKNNEFYLMAKKVSNISGLRFILFLFSVLFPKLSRFLRLPVLSPSVGIFFTRIIKESIRQREKEGLIRPDMIQLLMEARQGKIVHDDDNLPDTGFATAKELSTNRSYRRKLELSDEDITAQALTFIFGGFETSSSLTCFIVCELAMNPEIQKKLQKEIDETRNSCDGKLTYEALHKMNYLDMIVSETLRKWPPGFQMDRVCVKDYTIEPVNPWEKPLVIEKDTLVLIPVVGIHHDPEYYPNPEIFDPERFSDENKHKIKPFSYIPFGIGPRHCIASRFALMQNKTLIFYLLSKFDIVCVNKTPNQIKIAKATVNFVIEGGFWFGLKRREHS